MQFTPQIDDYVRLARRSAIGLLALATLAILPEAGHCGEKDPDAGPALYARNCSPCHYPLPKTLLKNRSVKRILSAIDHVPAMNKLRSLSESELEAIADVLADPSAGR